MNLESFNFALSYATSQSCVLTQQNNCRNSLNQYHSNHQGVSSNSSPQTNSQTASLKGINTNNNTHSSSTLLSHSASFNSLKSRDPISSRSSLDKSDSTSLSSSSSACICAQRHRISSQGVVAASAGACIGGEQFDPLTFKEKPTTPQPSFLLNVGNTEGNKRLFRCQLNCAHLNALTGGGNIKPKTFSEEPITLPSSHSSNQRRRSLPSSLNSSVWPRCGSVPVLSDYLKNLLKKNSIHRVCSLVKFSIDHPLSDQPQNRRLISIIQNSSLEDSQSLSIEAELVICVSLLSSQKYSKTAESRLVQRLEHCFAKNEQALLNLSEDFQSHLSLRLGRLSSELQQKFKSLLKTKSGTAEEDQTASEDLFKAATSDIVGGDSNQDCVSEICSTYFESGTSKMDHSHLEGLVREVGGGLTSSRENCESTIKQLAQAINAEPNALFIAKLISTLCRTHVVVSDDSIWLPSGNMLMNGGGWNQKDHKSNGGGNSEDSSMCPGGKYDVDILVRGIQGVLPNLNWTDVVINFDHSGFNVGDKAGVKFLWDVLVKAFGGSANIPMGIIYGVAPHCPWRNADSQLCLLRQMVIHGSDLKLTECSPCTLVDMSDHKPSNDLTKGGTTSSSTQENDADAANWKILEVHQAFLQISQAAPNANLNSFIEEIYQPTRNACPEACALALLQLEQKMIPLRETILRNLFVHYLMLATSQQGTTATTTWIVGIAWNKSADIVRSQVQEVVKASLVEFYNLDSQDTLRLSKILEIAQENKCLQNLLSLSSYPFVIDLACLASRREYLKLDKWICDNLESHKEVFGIALCSFMTKRCPQLFGKEPDSNRQAPTLTQEAVGIIIKCLSKWASSCNSPQFPRDVAECIMTMAAAMNSFLKNTSLQAKNVNAAPPGPAGLSYPTGVKPPSQASRGIDGFVPSMPPNASIPSGHSLPPAPGPSPSAVLTPGLNAPRMDVVNPFGGGFGYPNAAAGAGSAILNPVNAPLQAGNAKVYAQLQATPNTMAHMSAAVPHLSQLPLYSDPNELFPDMKLPISKEVEDEANSYFQRIYNQPQIKTEVIQEFLDMLKKFSTSQNKNEVQVFNCMIKNLFEEYRFFHSYPDKELTITAQLFGGIIDNELVRYMPLAYAQRFVMDALKKPQSQKMLFFGIVALDCFKSKLKNFAVYCQYLQQLPTYTYFPEHLQMWVEAGSRGAEPPGRPEGPLPVLRAGKLEFVNKKAAPQTTMKASVASATNIDTLMMANNKMEKMVEPSEAIQDKIGFIINNLSQVNVAQKAEEFRDIVTDELAPWFANYLVMKRVSIEQNFHSLYANFLETLKSPTLNSLVIKETYRNIRVLLRSDRELADFTDRSLLKSLGHWLGMLTLAKNKYIHYDDLNLKGLLIEAYTKGQQELLYVVPFIAKILESSAKSIAFKPNCPYVKGLLYALVELHNEGGLKLNLKFEIEVLCKSLSMDITKLKEDAAERPSTLRDMNKYAMIETNPQLSQPQANVPVVPQNTIAQAPSNNMSAPNHHHLNSGQNVSNKNVNDMLPMVQQLSISSQQNLMHPMAPQEEFMPVPTNQVTSANVASSAAPQNPAVSTTPVQQVMPTPQYTLRDFSTLTASTIGHYVTVNTSLPLFEAHPQLRSQVKVAVERAIHEWMAPVVDRCLKIALVTCESIVKKDFALDPDEHRLRAALHNMVRSVTAGMVMITCRDPLIISISTTVKQLMITSLRLAGQNVLLAKEQIEQVTAATANDNVELACCFIQKTAMDKALIEVDKKFAPEYEARKTARKEGKVFSDYTVLSYQERMPEQIRLKLGPVPASQLAVYEEFARNVPGFAAQSSNERFPTGNGVGNNSGNNAVDRQGEYFANHFGHHEPVQPGLVMQRPPYVADDPALALLDKMQIEIEVYLNMLAINSTGDNPFMHNLRMVNEALSMFRNAMDMHSGYMVVQRIVESFLDGMGSIIQMQEMNNDWAVKYRDLHIYMLKSLAESRFLGSLYVVKPLTRILLEHPNDDIKYNLQIIDLLVRSNLISVQMLDVALAQAIENINYQAISLSKELVGRALPRYREMGLLSESDFQHTMESLFRRLNQQQQQHMNNQVSDDFVNQDVILSQRSINQLQDFSSQPISMMHSGMTEARNNEPDPPGLQDKTEYLLREWVSMYQQNQGKDSTKAFQVFVQQMNIQGILKTDDLITKFFRLATEMCVEHTYRQMGMASQQVGQQAANMANSNDQSSPQLGVQTNNTLAAHQMVNHARNKCFVTLDAYVRLIAMLVKLSGDTNNPTTKVNLLNKVLGIIAGVLIQDHENRNSDFRQLAYHRLFLMLYLELTAPEPILEVFSFQTLVAFCNTLHALHPSKVPGFAFSWLELISHRMFLARMLALTPQQKAWGMFAQLLNDLFKFLAPFLRNMELTTPVQLLYKGTIRVLLVLLHDFPEFLVDYHYGFCDLIPPNCVQMRNLILSAFPRHMRLPDPFTPNLKAENLQDNMNSPRVLPNYVSMIAALPMRKDLDNFLKNRAPREFLSELIPILQQNTEGGSRYNMPLINALVLYVGVQANGHLLAKNVTVNMHSVARNSFCDIFEHFMANMDNEGRYIVLNAIANQLRFPNSHTQYFSSMLLHLFGETYRCGSHVQEQITRVLLERLIVNRPHPWGLLVTFIELMKNESLRFWNYDFIHCAPEIEKLFESVAKSCVNQGKGNAIEQS